MNPSFDTSAIQEAWRRRSGQAPSSAGIPGGAPTANQPSAQNPLASFAQAQLPAQDAGLPASMNEQGIQQLQKSAPGEAEIILKALIQRLRSLGERGQ